MFKPVNVKESFPALEERILSLWKQNDIFQKSIDNRAGGPDFILYEGPPTANGSPGIHHVLTRVYKDVIPRYKSMKGFYTPRKAGWDTHGLPVELEVERELGINSKPQIEQFGVAEFNKRCKNSVLRYLKDWERLTDRIGYWTDMGKAYFTFENKYIESCWWIINQYWKNGLIYEGYRVTPHCPRCETSLSSHEVALGYDDNTVDPSIYIKFKVNHDTLPAELRTSCAADKTYFLVWTTTPWTLPGNVAIAVSPQSEYVLVELMAESGGNKVGEYLILAGSLLGTAVKVEYRVVARIAGRELENTLYQPLFNPLEAGLEMKKFRRDENGRAVLAEYMANQEEEISYPVICGDFVSMEDGTGIVHIAPAFGEIDYQVGEEKGLFFLQPVDLKGVISDRKGAWQFSGRFVKQADPEIIDILQQRGLMFRSEKITHTYPFCWRCNTPLLYYAKRSWYIRTTAKKERLISGNNEINWYPEHIRDGRFGDWLRNNVDWALSRERYWGTPLNVWRCDRNDSHMECIGSLQELKEKKGIHGLEEGIDLHRPVVDEITYGCNECGGTMRRVPDVLDAWFDSGAMPVAQFHYPFENEALFKQWFPADYICEGVDQTRGWFYTLHAISTLLFDKPCFNNVICLGLVLDSKGEKMSKTRGNVVDPWQLIKRYGADSLRWYLLTSTPAGNVKRFDEKQIGEVLKKFILTLWNTYSFFVTYANIDKYNPGVSSAGEPAELDRWILSELNLLIREVTEALDNYNPTDAGRKVEAFIDELSNWYVRRSRRRFWKSENDADKLAAYNTLYQCLTVVAKLIAPFVPFLAEEMYQNLVRGADSSAPESVHLTDFPLFNSKAVDEKLSEDNRLAMTICSLGRSARSKAGIKIRQPLSRVLIAVKTKTEEEGLKRLSLPVLEELNVKEIVFAGAKEIPGEKPGEYAVAQDDGYAVAVDLKVSEVLAQEGIAREVVHRLQTMRRSAGFDIADYICTYYEAGPELTQVFNSFGAYIKQETLSRELISGADDPQAYRETHKLGGETVTLSVKKV